MELIKIRQKYGYRTWIAKGKNLIDMPHCEEADEINQPWWFHLFACLTVHKTVVQHSVMQVVQYN